VQLGTSWTRRQLRQNEAHATSWAPPRGLGSIEFPTKCSRNYKCARLLPSHNHRATALRVQLPAALLLPWRFPVHELCNAPGAGRRPIAAERRASFSSWSAAHPRLVARCVQAAGASAGRNTSWSGEWARLGPYACVLAATPLQFSRGRAQVGAQYSAKLGRGATGAMERTSTHMRLFAHTQTNPCVLYNSSAPSFPALTQRLPPAPRLPRHPRRVSDPQRCVPHQLHRLEDRHVSGAGARQPSETPRVRCRSLWLQPVRSSSPRCRWLAAALTPFSTRSRAAACRLVSTCGGCQPRTAIIG
jgi:hypothetical protein